MSDELLKLRNEIDRIDEEILARLAERARCAQRVGEIKRGVMYYRPEREAQVLRRLAELNPGPLSADAVKTIFREVMSACLGLEQPLRVGRTSGPAGTFFGERQPQALRVGAQLHADGRPLTTCSARSRPATPTMVWCRWRIPPRARSAARSTCCSPIHSRSAARCACAST